jgi:type VI secretion system protein ImpL
MFSKQVMQIILAGVGLTSLAALIWLAGPLIAFGDYRPLENHIVREILILVLTAVVAGFVGLQIFRRKKGSKEIAEGIAEGEKQPDDDSEVLQERMKDALATLRKASGGKTDYLYDLPWYVLIGPPGSGKTTALVNSGLKFPLARGATPAAVAGVGGTRYCDWWFTEDAVLIDTAGRYTTQDSDAKADKQSWLAFLDVLKKNRPRQPINGVMVAISLGDLMTLPPAEINAHANAIRTRLLELHSRLKVDFPVYVLFTKADLISGFIEFFGSMSDQGRMQVWGATFQTADKTRNMVGDVPIEYDELVQRLNEDLTDRLQEDPTPSSRVSLYGFPTQLAGLKRPIFDFLNQIFEPTRYHANATLRGFYFTSGTQQGTPIDRLIGALVKSFGAQEVASSAYSGLGKSFFLTDLVQKVVIGEASWVSSDPAALRRQRIIRACAYATVVLVAVALSAVWWISYSRNLNLINQTNAAVADFVAAAEPFAKETQIADRDLSKVFLLEQKLRFLPAGYEYRDAKEPMLSRFGLSQRDRLMASSVNSYHVALERMFRPRLIYRLEEQLEANRTNASFVYEALKVYLMIGGQQATDRELVMSWMRRDWAENLYPGAAFADGRKALEGHLAALLDLEQNDEPLVTLNGPLIENSQRLLARLSVAQRAYEILKSQARSSGIPDWVAAQHGGQDFDRVFETINNEDIQNVRVPGFLTYNGFRRAFIDRLNSIAEQMNNEKWVLGATGEQSAIQSQYATLGPDLLDIYTKDFIETWRRTLGRLRLKRMNADKPQFLTLAAVSAATSPLRQLLESILTETAVTRERPNTAQQGGSGGAAAASKDAKPANAVPVLLRQDRAPGEAIEAAFKPFHLVIEGSGGQRSIDLIIGNFNEIYQSLQTMATNPTQATQANQALQQQVVNLKNNATRLPSPFSDMLLATAASFEGDVATTIVADITRKLSEQVAGVCRQLAEGRYPMTRGSRTEITPIDFGRLFKPNGVIDLFFQQNLTPYADTSKPVWTWRQDSPVAARFSAETLRNFQRAAQIRDAFFATGGNVPSFALSVLPPAFTGSGVSVKFEIAGTPVTSPSGTPAPGASNSPVNVQWPGAGGRTAITVVSDVPGSTPSVFERGDGPWALFRILDAAGAPAARGDKVTMNLVVGGLPLQYQISTGSVFNPLALPALRDFRCPTSMI